MIYLDDAKTAEIESLKVQLYSHQKQISKLFAVSTEKMRAFSVRSVHASEVESKLWDRGTCITHKLCDIMTRLRPYSEII